jgi:hypothetical protein
MGGILRASEKIQNNSSKGKIKISFYLLLLTGIVTQIACASGSPPRIRRIPWHIFRCPKCATAPPRSHQSCWDRRGHGILAGMGPQSTEKNRNIEKWNKEHFLITFIYPFFNKYVHKNNNINNIYK